MYTYSGFPPHKRDIRRSELLLDDRIARPIRGDLGQVRNKGAAGIDGETLDAGEAYGPEQTLDLIVAQWETVGSGGPTLKRSR